MKRKTTNVEGASSTTPFNLDVDTPIILSIWRKQPCHYPGRLICPPSSPVESLPNLPQSFRRRWFQKYNRRNMSRITFDRITFDRINPQLCEKAETSDALMISEPLFVILRDVCRQMLTAFPHVSRRPYSQSRSQSFNETGTISVSSPKAKSQLLPVESSLCLKSILLYHSSTASTFFISYAPFIINTTRWPRLSPHC